MSNIISPQSIQQQLLQGQRADIAPTTGVPQPQIRPEQAAIAQALQQQQAPTQQFATPQGASLASELLSVSQDRLGNPIIRGLAGFLGAKELGKEKERAGAEKRRAEEARGAAAQAQAQQQQLENVRAEEELALKRQGLEAKQELNLFNRDRQAAQDDIAVTERARKADLDERRLRLSEDAATGKIATAKAAKEQGKIDQEFAVIEADANASNSINLIDDLITHPGLDSAVGFGLGDRFIPGTEGADFQARFEQIKGEAFLKGFQSLKGGGTITEAEGKKAENAIARMSLSQSETEFKKAADEFKTIISTGLDRDKAKAKAKGITVRDAPKSAPTGEIKFLGFE